MLPSGKLATLVVPQTVTNAGTLTGYVDTKGFDFAVITLVSETVAANKIPTVLRLSQTDSVPTAFTDGTVLTQFVGGTATTTAVGFVIPTPVTTTSVGVNTYCVQFNVDLRGKKRYLPVEFSPITTHTLSVDAHLYRADELPISSTKANVLALVEG